MPNPPDSIAIRKSIALLRHIPQRTILFEEFTIFWQFSICVEVLRSRSANHTLVEDHLTMRNPIPHQSEDGLENVAYPSVLSEEDCVAVTEISKNVARN